MLLFFLIFITLLNTVDALCYEAACRSANGQPGCKHIIRGTKDLDDEACCKIGKSVGYADENQGLGGGCYRCDKCRDILTKKNGGWSEWSPWSPCTKTCGGGFTTSTRECNNPPPSKLGKPCEGDPSVRESCGTKTCPINGGWSKWSPWSSCNKSCGKGTISRQRSCTEPPPQHGGFKCPGSVVERKDCVLIPNCPVHGNWSPWSPWAPCSKTCTTGQTERMRRCSNPAPAHGGSECKGLDSQKKACTLVEKCPIHGGWSSWSNWGACSKTCSKGITQRDRTCTNPRPQHNGNDCPGKKSEKKECTKIKNCPIDGNWGAWSGWSQCDATCGGGKILRRRHCDNPKPQFKGKRCSGQSVERKPCNENPCPVHGGWSEWSEWGRCIFADCNNTRDGGLQTRSRSCTNPTPDIGGRMCLGKIFDTGFCAEKENCARDGGWSSWSPWKCQSVGANRLRKCDDPEPDFGGKTCPGQAFEWITVKNNKQGFCAACPGQCNKVVTSRPATPKYLTTIYVSEEPGSTTGSGDGSGDDAED